MCASDGVRLDGYRYEEIVEELASFEAENAIGKVKIQKYASLRTLRKGMHTHARVRRLEKEVRNQAAQIGLLEETIDNLHRQRGAVIVTCWLL